MTYKEFINTDYIKVLEQLHKEKKLLKDLIDSKQINEPLIIELSGLPRTGKTTSCEQLYDFFKKGGFKIYKTEEPTYSIKKSLNLNELRNMSNVEFNDKTLEICRNNLLLSKNTGSDIIIMDRGIIDNYFWYQLYYEKGLIDDITYNEYLVQLKKDLKFLDQLFLLTALPIEILNRDFNNSIYLEQRNKTNLKNINQLVNAYNNLEKEIQDNFSDIVKIDTTLLTPRDTSILIAERSIKAYQKKLTKK